MNTQNQIRPLASFQAAVNAYSASSGDVRVALSKPTDADVRPRRVTPIGTSCAPANREVRAAFKDALTSAFGVDRLEDLPDDVKSVLKIRDFKLSKDGEVRSGRPLTLRRIRAVLGAVQKVAVSSTEGRNEQRKIETEFSGGLATSEDVDAAIRRYAIAVGRLPMEFTMPGGARVSVPMANMKAYLSERPSERMASKVDALCDEIQLDIRKGCALYQNLMAGQDCVSSPENKRALKCYLSFVALAHGKGQRNRLISVPDGNGRLAAFFGEDGASSGRRVKFNENVAGSIDRFIFLSDIAPSGAKESLSFPKDLDGRYMRLKSNAFASSLLQRTASHGMLTVAQMQANVIAELRRLGTVGEEELARSIQAECGRCNLDSEEGRAAAVRTKAFQAYENYRLSLNEYLIHLQTVRADLDAPEARIADETVLTEDEIAAVSEPIDGEGIVSPRGVVRPAVPPPNVPDQLASTPEWRNSQICLCGAGNYRAGLAVIVACLREGYCLPGVLLPEGEVPAQVEGEADLPREWAAFVTGMDAKLLADVVWYVSSRACSVDGLLRHPIPGAQAVDLKPPVWTALRNGVIDRNFPPESCRLFAALFAPDNPAANLAQRVGQRRISENPGTFRRDDPASKAASVVWGFGTNDIARIARFAEDCGYVFNEISPADLERLAALAAVHDYKLEEVPTFIQRQTGKTPAEISRKDIEELFRLKMSRRLNDKGAHLKGASGEIVDILKGDRLPSMTGASGKDVSRLLSALRQLDGANPGASCRLVVQGRLLTMRLTLSGALVFCVDGLEYRAAKTPREFIEIFQDDAVAHVDRFGTHLVLKTLPQVRSAEVPEDSVASARSRELCLRFLKGTLDIDPAMLASVSTRELYAIAEGAVDGRYRLRSGECSHKAVASLIERSIDTSVLTSQEAAELCRSLETLRARDQVSIRPIASAARSPSSGMTDEVRRVHDMMAELILDANPLDFDKSQASSGPSHARVLAVLRRNVPALVAIIKNPSLATTFPEEVAVLLTESFGGILRAVSFAGQLAELPAEELERHLNFVLAMVDKPARQRAQAVDRYLAGISAPSQERQETRSLFDRVVGSVTAAASMFFGAAVPANAAQNMAPVLLRAPILAAINDVSRSLVGIEERIVAGVREAMGMIQERFGEALGPQGASSGSAHPLWAQEFDEIIGNAMSDANGGYGMFMKEVLGSYFTESDLLEQRQMLASFARCTDATSSPAAMAGALFRGAGPLLQKMLQGLPQTAFGPDLAGALQDMKSNLQPIPDVFVEATMQRIIARSGGRIRSITVESSLGAASVGQAFLCRMVTDEQPQGEECVVKILRPTVKMAIARERALFERAAARVPGMAQTFKGQLARILEELDFTFEATNINFGRNVYEQPTYLRQTSLLSDAKIETLCMTTLHSMDVHPLTTPTMDCLVLKKAPGVTYDRYMAQVRRRVDELLTNARVENGRIGFATMTEAACIKRELAELYSEVLKRQKFLLDLTKKWVHEGLFGNGFYHGDLHAGNIMTDGNGLTVIDFGNATHLSDFERSHVLRMICAALAGWHGSFESSFKALLSHDGRVAYDTANADGKISRDLADILHKGTRHDIGMRISAALMVLQRHGIEVPSSIYNFNQCQVRLGATVDDMNALLDVLRNTVEKVSAAGLPEFGQDLDGISVAFVNALRGVLSVASGERVARPEAWAAEFSILEAVIGERRELGWTDLPERAIDVMADELRDKALCDGIIYPVIDRIRRIPWRTAQGSMRSNSGAMFELGRAFDVYRRKQEPTLLDRKALAKKLIVAARELYDISREFLSVQVGERPVSFLETVGDGISDSLYTVRTTLGNVKSVELLRAQEAEDRRMEEAKRRQMTSDNRVEEFLLAHPQSELGENDVVAIRDAAGRLNFPYDLPGIDGRIDWRASEARRKEMYGALVVVVKRLLSDLAVHGVITAESSENRFRNAVCVAMRYLADRTGGVFEAFRDVSNAHKILFLAEAGAFVREQNEGATERNPNEEMLRAENLQQQGVLAALNYFMSGGAMPIQTED